MNNKRADYKKGCKNELVRAKSVSALGLFHSTFDRPPILDKVTSNIQKNGMDQLLERARPRSKGKGVMAKKGYTLKCFSQNSDPAHIV